MLRHCLTAVVCAALASPAFAIEPIPGSITYGGANPKLQKSPPGSTLINRIDDGSNEYEERYVVQPDHSLKLVSRVRRAGR